MGIHTFLSAIYTAALARLAVAEGGSSDDRGEADKHAGIAREWGQHADLSDTSSEPFDISPPYSQSATSPGFSGDPGDEHKNNARQSPEHAGAHPTLEGALVRRAEHYTGDYQPHKIPIDVWKFKIYDEQLPTLLHPKAVSSTRKTKEKL